MRIVSWNVNGIRAAFKKGFCNKVAEFGADIIGIQETKAQTAQVLDLCQNFEGYYCYASSAERAGYSGVALFSKQEPQKIISSLNDDSFDREGRMIAAFFDKFLLLNVYFPNGSGKDGDNSRVPYKLAFYDALFAFLDQHQGPKFIIGDFNTAHQEIDLARPKENINTSGFLAIERECFSKILEKGYLDTFRYLNPSAQLYSYWNMRFKARERNVGWRIDGVLASTNAMPLVKNSFIWPEVLGSDHCPVGVELY